MFLIYNNILDYKLIFYALNYDHQSDYQELVNILYISQLC